MVLPDGFYTTMVNKVCCCVYITAKVKVLCSQAKYKQIVSDTEFNLIKTYKMTLRFMFILTQHILKDCKNVSKNITSRQNHTETRQSIRLECTICGQSGKLYPHLLLQLHLRQGKASKGYTVLAWSCPLF